MRADAERNRERLLDATVELVLDVGAEPTRDAIAARAGVGIGTLYRHFPDQQSLLRATALHVLDRTLTAGEAAVADADTAADALRAYMHVAVDTGLGALQLVHPLIDDTDWPDRRARAENLVQGIVERAHHEKRLRRDVTVDDIVFAVLRSCRSLSIGLSAEEDRDQAHRHVDLFLDGATCDTSDGPAG